MAIFQNAAKADYNKIYAYYGNICCYKKPIFLQLAAHSSKLFVHSLPLTLYLITTRVKFSKFSSCICIYVVENQSFGLGLAKIWVRVTLGLDKSDNRTKVAYPNPVRISIQTLKPYLDPDQDVRCPTRMYGCPNLTLTNPLSIKPMFTYNLL